MESVKGGTDLVLDDVKINGIYNAYAYSLDILL